LLRVLPAILLAGWSSQACAQTFQGSFTGLAVDASGAAIPSAAVTARETRTDLTRNARTDQNGRYEIPLLPPGSYRISVEKQGFERVEQGPIEVAVNRHLEVDFQSDTPRRAGGLMSGTASKAVAQLV